MIAGQREEDSLILPLFCFDGRGAGTLIARGEGLNTYAITGSALVRWISNCYIVSIYCKELVSGWA